MISPGSIFRPTKGRRKLRTRNSRPRSPCLISRHPIPTFTLPCLRKTFIAKKVKIRPESWCWTVEQSMAGPGRWRYVLPGPERGGGQHNSLAPSRHFFYSRSAFTMGEHHPCSDLMSNGILRELCRDLIYRPAPR